MVSVYCICEKAEIIETEFPIPMVARMSREGPSRLLCVAYGGGHIRACIPVLLDLQSRGWRIDLLALTTAYQTAVDAGLSAWRVRDLIEVQDKLMLAQGAKLAKDFPKNHSISFEETAAYLAFGYQDLVFDYGRNNAAHIYAQRGRSAFSARTLAIRALNRFRPDIVLATNSPRAEKAVIDEAQARGIPAALINDLFASPSNYWLHDPTYADRIFVLNEFVRERFIASGHDPDKIIVTGNPAFNPLINLRKRRTGRAKGSRQVILYASQPFNKEESWHKERVLRQLKNLAVRRVDWDIRIRLHPSEVAADVNPGASLKIDPAAGIEEALTDADVVLTHGSTVGLEANIAGVPSVLIKGSSIAKMVPYDEMGISVPVSDVEHIESAIEVALEREFTAESIDSMPADSAERIASSLESLVNGR